MWQVRMHMYGDTHTRAWNYAYVHVRLSIYMYMGGGSWAAEGNAKLADESKGLRRAHIHLSPFSSINSPIPPHT